MSEITFDVNGLPGQRGYSAYEVAVLNGFEGTEEEWLTSLKGAKGDTPQITAEKENGVATLYADGEAFVQLTDGAKGDEPQITAEKENGVTTLSVDGVPVVTIPDGVDGMTITSVTADENGCLHFTFNTGDPFVTDSVKGAPGYSPVRGTDYWTAEDIAAVVEAACQAAIAQYPEAEEEEY